MSRAPVIALITVAVVASACAATTPSATPSASPPPASVAPSTVPPTLTTTPSTSAAPSASTEVLPGESWIAFQTNGAAGYGVYLVREDGTGLHHWPSGIAGGYEHPDWSPDGQRILVNSVEVDGTEDLWSAYVDGSDAVRHVDCVAPCRWADEAAWSPDGTRIAFQRLVVDTGVFRSTLEILDVATGEVSVVLTMPDLQVVLAPRWSPGGDRLVVEVIDLETPSEEADLVGGGIGVVDLTAAAPTVSMVAPFTTFAQSPDWSPDGSQLIYAQPSADDGGVLDLHGIAPDGTAERRITDLAANGDSAIQPAFAPDGDRIVFLLTRAGRQETVMALVDLDARTSGLPRPPATRTATTRGCARHPEADPSPHRRAARLPPHPGRGG
jgi:Tol biopolymer transport system component